MVDHIETFSIIGEWELCDKIRSLKNTLLGRIGIIGYVVDISFRIRSHHMHYSEAVRDLSKV